jgi:hypothetical protein
MNPSSFREMSEEQWPAGKSIDDRKGLPLPLREKAAGL